MKKLTITILSVIVLSLFLAGCPCDCWMHLYENIGKGIANLPQWSYGAAPGESFSQWEDWTGSKLRQLLPTRYNRQDYRGKYRLVMIGQNLGIEFEDGNAVVFFYLWLGAVTEDDCDEESITIPQETADVFSFSGTAKFDFADSSQDKPATITLTKKSEDDKRVLFNYKLEIAGAEMVNTDFAAMKAGYFTSNTIPRWLPDTFHKTKDDYDCKYIFRDLRTGDETLVTTGFRCFSAAALGYDSLGTVTTNELFYHGGMKQVSLDDSQKKVVYQLLDGAPNSPRYVELHRNTDTTVQFTWFNLPESQTDTTADRSIVKEETLYVQE